MRYFNLYYNISQTNNMALYYIMLIFINVKILISFQNPSISLKKI